MSHAGDGKGTVVVVDVQSGVAVHGLLDARVHSKLQVRPTQYLRHIAKLEQRTESLGGTSESAHPKYAITFPLRSPTNLVIFGSIAFKLPTSSRSATMTS